MRFHVKKKFIYIFSFLIFSLQILACASSCKKPKISKEEIKIEQISKLDSEQVEVLKKAAEDRLFDDLESTVMVLSATADICYGKDNIRKWIRNHLEDVFDDDEPTLVAYKDLEDESLLFCGFISSSESWDDDFEISELCFYIVRECRGQGIFSRLFFAYESLLRERPYYEENYFQISFRYDNEVMRRYTNKFITQMNFFEIDNKQEEPVYNIKEIFLLKSKEKIMRLRRQVKLPR